MVGDFQMQKGIRKHVWIYVIVSVLVAIMLVPLYYQFGYLPQKQSGTSPQQKVGLVGGQSVNSPQPTGSSTVVPNVTEGGPAIFATLAFSNETGFVTTTYPTSGTTEFVLLPNSVGKFTVTYTGFDYNNLSISAFSVTNPVPVLNVLSNGTLVTSSGLSVTESSVTQVSYYQVIVNYIVTSGGSDGLYVLGLPSTSLSTPIVNVGTQPYTGTLPCLNLG